MINDIRTRLTVDNAQQKRGIQESIDQMVSLKNVSDEVTSRLSGLFTLGTLEEGVRRTAEWADNLREVSEQAKASTGEIQAMVRAGEHVYGVTQEKILAFYNKLGAAIDEAAQKGGKMADVLSRAMGKSLTSNMTQGDIMNNIINNPQASEIDLRTIFGKDAPKFEQVSDIIRGQGGMQASQGQGVMGSNEEINSISDTWHSILDDFKEIGVELVPIFGMLLQIVHGLTSILHGVVGTLAGAGGDIFHLFKGDTNRVDSAGRLVGRVAGMGMGIIKNTAELADLATFHKFNIAGTANKGLKPWTDSLTELLPKQSDMEMSSEAGAGLAMVLSGGSAGAKSLLRRGIKTVGGSIDIVSGGRTAFSKIGENALKDTGGKLEQGAVGLTAESYSKAYAEALKFMQEHGIEAVGGVDRKALVKFYTEYFAKYGPKALTATANLSQLAIAGQMPGSHQAGMTPETFGQLQKEYGGGIIPSNKLMGEKNPYLEIGGMLGSGFNANLLNLTAQMNNHLSTIATAVLARQMAYKHEPHMSTEKGMYGDPHGGLL